MAMSKPGMGVMIAMLAGDRGAEHLQAALGKEIASAEIKKSETLELRFTDGSGVALFDDGQSCCEHRYMNSDDDLTYHVGATLLDVEIGESKEEDTGEVKETQFLLVRTSKGVITVANYNEHNGYYGGFYMKAGPLGATPRG